MAETINDEVLLAWKMLEDDLFATDDELASEEEKNLRLLANTDLGDEPKETFEQTFKRIAEEIRDRTPSFDQVVFLSPSTYNDLEKE